MQTGLGTHIVDHLLQGHCKMLREKQDIVANLVPLPDLERHWRTFKSEQHGSHLFNLMNGTLEDQGEGRMEVGSRGFKPLNFSRWSNTLCDIPTSLSWHQCWRSKCQSRHPLVACQRTPPAPHKTTSTTGLEIASEGMQNVSLNFAYAPRCCKWSYHDG